MKQLVTVFFVLFIFSCESEPVEGFDESTEEASLVFPEAECGEVALEADGFPLVLNQDAKASTDGGCQVNLHAQFENPDGSRVFIFIRFTNLDSIDYTLEDYSSAGDYCNTVRVYLGFVSAIPDDDAEGYSSFPEYGGEGVLTVSDFNVVYDDDIDNFITGTFELTAGLVQHPADPSAESIHLIGSFNKIPVEFFCGSPYC